MAFDRSKFSASRPEAAKVFVARTTGEKLPVTEEAAVRSEALRRALVGVVDAGEIALAAQDARSAAGTYDVGHGSQEELDAARAVKAKRGRKPKRETLKGLLTATVKPEEQERVEAAALETGVTVSAWLRRLVRKELGI